MTYGRRSHFYTSLTWSNCGQLKKKCSDDSIWPDPQGQGNQLHAIQCIGRHSMGCLPILNLVCMQFSSLPPKENRGFFLGRCLVLVILNASVDGLVLFSIGRSFHSLAVVGKKGVGQTVNSCYW